MVHELHAKQVWSGDMHDKDGNQFFIDEGYIHRLGAPAIIWTDNTEWWMKGGYLHRHDGPAKPIASNEPWGAYGRSYSNMNEWAKAIGIYDSEHFVELKLKYG